MKYLCFKGKMKNGEGKNEIIFFNTDLYVIKLKLGILITKNKQRFEYSTIFTILEQLRGIKVKIMRENMNICKIFDATIILVVTAVILQWCFYSPG